MKCPDCEVDLLLAERAGVELNYCPRCRGVWLERGRLDQIIERSIPVAHGQRGPQPGGYPPYQPDPNNSYNQRPYRDHDDDDGDDEHGRRDSRYGPDGRKRRRGGFLGDFLDFG